MKTNVHFLSYIAQFFIEENVLDKICRNNQNTHFMFNNIFPEIMLFTRYCGKRCRARQTVWLMRFVCWIIKATDTYLEYVIPVAFHGNSGYANALQCSVSTYIACILDFRFRSYCIVHTLLTCLRGKNNFNSLGIPLQAESI